MTSPDCMLVVEVVYALPGKCWRWKGELARGARVRDAVRASGFAEAHPGVAWERSVGIFSALVDLDAELAAGDRVEIYRSLVCDPMEARRRRAAAQRRK